MDQSEHSEVSTRFLILALRRRQTARWRRFAEETLPDPPAPPDADQQLSLDWPTDDPPLAARTALRAPVRLQEALAGQRLVWTDP